MNYLKTIFCISLLLLIINGCDMVIEPNDQKVDLEEGEKEVSGIIELPESIDPLSLSVVSSAGTYPVLGDRRFNSAVSDSLTKQFLFAENEAGEVMLATMSTNNDVTINTATTARAILALAPWTGFVDDNDLNLILDQAKQLNEYESFEQSVSTSIEQGISPMLNEEVIEKLGILNNKILGVEDNSGGRIKEVPEVNYLVEPVITYSNSMISINNDGTTTAAWGVEVFKENSSITGDLIIPGNTIQFPTLSSIVGSLFGNSVDAVFINNGALEIPISVEGKYKIDFASPRNVTTGLGRKSLEYNFLVAYEKLLGSVGLTPDLLLQITGCHSIYLSSTISAFEDYLETGTLDAKEISKMIASGMTTSFTESLDCYIEKSSRIPNKHYLNKIKKFLDVYSKLELVYVLSKQVGDMLALNDLEVCRQVLNNNMYPCFSLVKDQEIIGDVTPVNENTKLKVYTVLDNPGEVEAFPEGAPIYWDLIQGEGSLQSSKTYVGMDGIAEVYYTPETEGDHVIRASVKEEGGKILSFANYEISVVDVDSVAIYEAEAIGTWTVYVINSGEIDYSNPRDLTLLEGGTGYYTSSNTTYYISWSIVKYNGRYFLSEDGFWHYGFEAYRDFNTTLENAPLTYPVTSFLTYNNFGEGPYASRKYIKNK